MNKYNIEGGLDFFTELYKSLDVEESEEKTEEDKNKCLITNQVLTDKYVTMSCGHKFNYIPLYHDLVNHKNKFNQMEGSQSKLNTNEIRCPYCRKKQEGTLIYYEELGLQKVNGVNFYDPNLKQSSHSIYTSHKCEFKWPNQNYNPTKPESQLNSKYLNYQSCGHYHGTQISIYNNENPSQPITYGDTHYYCYTHKKEMIKQYKLQQKEKEKEEKKQAKILEKEMKLLEKQNAKQKAKEEKQIAKETAKALKKNPMSENVVLGPSIIENQNGCVQILKTGPNKGKPCGCNIALENMCKRHYTLNHKELIIHN
jgi:hypothetical protein